LFDGLEDDLEMLVVFGVFFLKGFDFFGERALESISRRSWTKVRMMAMFTSTARGERRTLESMATPCSVKA
jgi:hypothetical protein